MICDAKYSGKPRMLNYMAEQLFLLAANEFHKKPHALIPVPLHRSREWDRKYNQAQVLANEVGRIWNVPVIHGLRKIGKRVPQSSLSASARKANLKGAFQVSSNVQLPASIMLI
ncbi:MAG: hypothetical protein C5B54_09630, partial [Acidobacteria bacterium]